MKYLSKLLVILLFISVVNSVQGQGKIQFEKTQHDFGNIKEVDGKAEVIFKFKNVGNKPLKLTKVKASCGCTTPTWTKEAVQPNGTGTIKAAYDAKNRPGPFNKSITVTTDGTPQIVSLGIKGKVIPRPKGPKDWYPVQIGNLRFKTTYMNFVKVKHDSQKDTLSTIIYNEGTKPITVNLGATKTPAPVKLSIDKVTIQPKNTAKLTISYNASLKKDWGYVYDRFELVTNDDSIPNKRFNVSANIIENFGKVDANSLVPKAVFNKTTHNFGKIKQHTQNKTSFMITNEGKAPLIIRKTKASCGCTATQPQKNELAPGESTTLDVTFSSGNKKNKQKKYVDIITNDPANSQTKIWIEADILVDGQAPKPKSAVASPVAPKVAKAKAQAKPIQKVAVKAPKKEVTFQDIKNAIDKNNKNSNKLIDEFMAKNPTNAQNEILKQYQLLKMKENRYKELLSKQKQLVEDAEKMKQDHKDLDKEVTRTQKSLTKLEKQTTKVKAKIAKVEVTEEEAK